MKLNAKFFNLLFFASLVGSSTAFAAALGFWQCLMFFRSPFNHYSYAIPESLYWTTGVILPLLTFLQSLTLFKTYLIVSELKNNHFRSKALPFIIIFAFLWSMISPCALAYGTVWKFGHIAPDEIAELFPKVMQAFLYSAPTLVNALIATVCIAVYSTFVWFALDNLFGDYAIRLKTIRR